MNAKTKASALVLAIASLSVANLVVRTGESTSREWLRVITPNPGTCPTGPTSIPSKKDLKRLLNFNVYPVSTYNCSTCELEYSTNQHWCQHLSSVCPDPYPWHENYEYERGRRWYKCPFAPYDVYICDSWVDSGCCGTSDPSEPECAPNGHTCIPGTEPEIG